MIIVDFRIIVPFSLEEYERGQRYLIARKTLDEVRSGQGVDVREDSMKERDGVHGRYTYKVIHFGKKIPKWIRWAIPRDKQELHEVSFNAFPISYTDLTIPGFGSKFSCKIQSQYREYKRGEDIDPNPHHMSDADLSKRHIYYIDICNTEPIDAKHDPRVWKSSKRDFGPLGDFDHLENSSSPPAWTETYNGPMICCHKLVMVKAKMEGLSKQIERFAAWSLCKNLFLDTHRLLYCWSDEWIDMDPHTLGEFEEQGNKELAEFTQLKAHNKSKTA